MKISIVTISFNQIAFLKHTIDSVISQKYNNLEYIIVDAGSTDGSRDLIDQYKNNISKIIFEPDNGPADGLNKGFSFASGEIFGFVNSDDVLQPDALKNVSTFFLKKDCDAVCGNGFVIDNKNKKIKRVFSDKFTLKKYAYGAFNFIQPSFFFRREAYVKAGGFNSANNTCWDAELLVDIVLSGGKVCRLSKFLSGFRLYQDSISGSGRLKEEYLLDRERIFKKIIQGKIRIPKILIKNFYRTINLIETPQKILSNF